MYLLQLFLKILNFQRSGTNTNHQRIQSLHNRVSVSSIPGTSIQQSDRDCYGKSVPIGRFLSSDIACSEINIMNPFVYVCRIYLAMCVISLTNKGAGTNLVPVSRRPVPVAKAWRNSIRQTRIQSRSGSAKHRRWHRRRLDSYLG